MEELIIIAVALPVIFSVTFTIYVLFGLVLSMSKRVPEIEPMHIGSGCDCDEDLTVFEIDVCAKNEVK